MQEWCTKLVAMSSPSSLSHLIQLDGCLHNLLGQSFSWVPCADSSCPSGRWVWPSVGSPFSQAPCPAICCPPWWVGWLRRFGVPRDPSGFLWFHSGALFARRWLSQFQCPSRCFGKWLVTSWVSSRPRCLGLLAEGPDPVGVGVAEICPFGWALAPSLCLRRRLRCHLRSELRSRAGPPWKVACKLAACPPGWYPSAPQSLLPGSS